MSCVVLVVCWCCVTDAEVFSPNGPPTQLSLCHTWLFHELGKRCQKRLLMALTRLHGS